MWPFSKTEHKSLPLETIAEETICPLCFERHRAGEIIKDYPFCPECSSEAIDIEVEPFNSFIANKTVEDFGILLAQWEEAEGFLPAYKELKRNRLMDLRRIKLTR